MGVLALPVPHVAWFSDLHRLDHRPHRLAIPGRLVGPTGGARTGPGVGERVFVTFGLVLKRMIRTPGGACGSLPWTTRERLQASSLPMDAPTGRPHSLRVGRTLSPGYEPAGRSA